MGVAHIQACYTNNKQFFKGLQGVVGGGGGDQSGLFPSLLKVPSKLKITDMWVFCLQKLKNSK